MTRASDLAKLLTGGRTLGGTGEVIVKDIDTADGSSPKITLQTGDTDIASADVLGTIDFQAPDEGTGTDAILVAAGIEAVSEGDFSSSSNATSLVFKTGASEAATEKVRVDSAGRVGIGITPSAIADSTGVDSLQLGGSFLSHFDEDAGGTLSLSNNVFFDGTNNKAVFTDEASQYYQSGGIHVWRNSPSTSAGANVTLTEVMRIDASGHVTKPLQSAFFAHADTAQSNIATSTNVDVTFGTERFDQNGDFASSVFTAPVTGKYQFNVNVRLNTVDQAAGYYICYLVTSNKNYFTIYDPGQFAGDPDFWTQSLSVVADMDASDTAKVRLLQNGGTAQSDVDGGPSDTPSNFSGYLVA